MEKYVFCIVRKNTMFDKKTNMVMSQTTDLLEVFDTYGKAYYEACDKARNLYKWYCRVYQKESNKVEMVTDTMLTVEHPYENVEIYFQIVDRVLK